VRPSSTLHATKMETGTKGQICQSRERQDSQVLADQAFQRIPAEIRKIYRRQTGRVLFLNN
jgi:hypothetical protein